MEGFLDHLAADLHSRYGEGISSLHVVFPSRRASLFFGEALSGIISRPLWQPAPITVDEVATELSGLVVGDRLRLVTELFKIYREFHPAESFDTFYFWGELLLGDFDSIDKYLVDADKLFSNLVDLRELDFLFDMEPGQRATIERFWGSFPSREGDGGGFSPEQRDFLVVWRTLGPVYHRFKARLRELGIAYQGMVYREAVERIRSGNTPQIPERHYVIAGFNALSRSEQALFDYLRREFRVDFYWDYDDYFTADEHQEAGMFMRDNLRRFPPARGFRGGHDNFEKPKKIRSVAAASDVLQCKYAGLVLADPARLSGHPPGKETAIVLCDESLLSPLLWSMPPGITGINITMGYPLRMHPAYTFVERLVELQNRRRERGRRNACGEDGGSVMFYHSDVKGLARHPYLAGSTPPRPHDNFVYVDASRLHTSPLFEKIFAAPDNDLWRALSDYLIEVISTVSHLPLETVADGREGDAAGQRTEFFATIVEHIRRLANSLEGCGMELSAKTYARLLRRSLQSVTVPFEGEPLEGVQVMGILETRALDFENIIFLSAGDDYMPGSLAGAPSFIPYNLKAAYGLPTPEHHEGVYAYHFFRLVQRARNVEMVWSRTTDDRSSGRPSRYILQLDYESPHEVSKETVSVDVNLSPSEPIVVEKGAKVMARLEEFLRRGDVPTDNDASRPEPRRSLSPSLFYTYVECPLKFYFRGVARLKAEDEVSEKVDGALFGNILHHAMQSLYEPLVGMRDPRRQIRRLIGSKEVERAVTAAVTELYAGDEGAGSENRGGDIVLVGKIITDYINRGILPFDGSLPVDFTIDSLEHGIETEVVFNSGDGTSSQSVLFSGVADRIDRLPDGALRVVDYKTGNPKNNASALLQMGLYATMLGGGSDTFPATGSIRKIDPVLYYVRDMSKPAYSPPPVEQGPEFEENLRATLASLFDPAVPFSQCADTRPCRWCDYAAICRR